MGKELALSIFDDPAARPSEEELRRALGSAFDNWETLRLGALQVIDGSEQEVGFGGRKFGWSWRIKRDGRLMLALSPGDCKFTASFALGEKALVRAKELQVAAWLIELIEAAPKYAEGRGVRIEVTPDTDVQPILRVVAIKAGRG